ncbi:hypothetical protein ACHWQZ_G008179 [Mnemiopsis leidyi]
MSNIWCCGRASDGQLGIVGNGSVLELNHLNIKGVSGDNIRNICGGKRSTVVLTRDGLLYTAGQAEILGRPGDNTPPAIVPSLEVFTIKSVACGEDHTVAVTSSGAICTWGFNSQGQCGHPPPQFVQKPTLLRPLIGVKVIHVSCGARHTLALCEGAEVFSWGDNSFGQLGCNPDVKNCHTPTRVTVLDGVPITQISAGANHNGALTVSGLLFMWGSNSFGQLGLGDLMRRPTPRLVHLMLSHCIVSVCCGEHHTAVLTSKGAVFTWGDGNYGQLGHGNTNQQIVPRQVQELMGDKIDVISCGYNHTIAMTSSREIDDVTAKLYGWGSCSSGQLGVGRVVHSIPTPTIFTDIWTEADNFLCDIYCGGEQTFVRFSKQNRRLFNNTRSCDLSEEKFRSTLADLEELNDPTQLVSYTSQLFGNVANINSLFVPHNTPADLSEGSGIDMIRMRKAMSQLRAVKHPDYHKAMSEVLENNVMPHLPSNIVTLEQLRVFCVLPEFPTLYYPKDFVPQFSQAILELPEQHLKALRNWWSGYEVSYFEALISVFKKSIYRSLVNRLHDPVENTKRLKNMEKCLKVLALLNEINSSKEIVPYNVFYIHELTDQLDLEEDYRNWIEHREVVFCKYPFVYTAGAKAKLLKIDANQQMMKTVQSIAVNQFLNRGQISINPFLELKVRRDNLIMDTLRQIQEYKSRPYLLKKPLKVTFAGEEGYDAGGVKKELFLLLMKELLSPDYGMFTIDPESRFVWFSEFSFEHTSNYHLIGVLCGLAIYNSTIVDINFPPALYKKLLKKPVTLNDFAKLHPVQANTLRQLLAYKDPDLEKTMCLTFSVTRDFFGELEEVDIVPNGRSKSVTLENKHEYVRAYVDYYMNKVVEAQYEAFAHGFLYVAGGKVFEAFHAEELMHMVSGMQDFNFKDLESITEYQNGYHADHPVIKLFWEMFHEMDLATKKKFLIFLTGSDRIPIHGIHSIKIIIQKVKDNSRLPVAHTCFNVLDLPPYPNKEMMRDKILTAIMNTEGFGLV